METGDFFPVSNSWTKESVRRLLATPGEEKNWFDSITSIFGHILTYLEEESASEHQEGPPAPPSRWAVLTILPCKITKIKMLTDWDVSPTPGGWKFFWDIPYTYLRYPESFVRKNHQELIFTFWSLFDSRVLTNAIISGKQYLQKSDGCVNVVIKRNGSYLIRTGESVDFSYCQKSKYN